MYVWREKDQRTKFTGVLKMITILSKEKGGALAVRPRGVMSGQTSAIKDVHTFW